MQVRVDAARKVNTALVVALNLSHVLKECIVEVKNSQNQLVNVGLVIIVLEELPDQIHRMMLQVGIYILLDMK